MTLSPPANAFAPQGLPHIRTPRPPRAGGAHAASLGITIAAHVVVVAALIFGIQVTQAPKMEKPIFVDIMKEQKKPDIKPVAPKFAPPTEVTMPPPLFEIAAPPPPNAIAAAPPQPVAPPPVAATPAPVETPSWNGQASYYGSLLAYLERFKQYPAVARAAHIEGQVFVHFVMTRDGTVTFSEIAKSSGRPTLDREALAMIQRAGKLPPMPEQMPGETLNGIIGPISFVLR
jgi:protein TonB